MYLVLQICLEIGMWKKATKTFKKLSAQFNVPSKICTTLELKK